MSGTRAAKSGFARDVQDKMNAKYDADVGKKVMDWVACYVTDEGFSTDGSSQNVQEVLGDGYILQKLLKGMNVALGKGEGKATKREKMAFKKMEQINTFLTAIGSAPFNVPNTELFQTVDLYEGMNMTSVVTCLAAVARKCQALGIQGFGPKEAEENRRSFTDEQLKAGQNVIGLQMGSNKGATQAGQNFGKGRMIVD